MTSETVVPVAESVADSTGTSNRFAAAHRVLEEAIAARAFPGCAFGVLSGGRIVDHGSLGRFIYQENSPAVLPDTVFDVASITKVAATTAAAMLLHQRGLLDPDTLVGDLLPGFIVGRPHTAEVRDVTLRHLLAHSSGLPGYVEFFRTHSTPAALFRACLDLPLEATPGKRAEYSDPGFILLGKALEVIMGEPLPQFVNREIFDSLGMHATSFCPRLSARHAIPPTEEDSHLRFRIIQGEVQDENAYVLHGVAGHAGLFSNVTDLLRFAAEILAASGHPSMPEPSRLFVRGTIERFSERQGPAGSSRALGWDTPSENSSSGRFFAPRSIGHLGFSGCSLWIDLAAGVAVVLLTNRTWPDRTNQTIRQVRPSFHDAVRQAL
ncbi:MAG TPA: serine hydrolase domain-containing protein [Terracidiphilus sp.]|jgi:CubicO group peptidase (beta-lactamase class C family)